MTAPIKSMDLAQALRTKGALLNVPPVARSPMQQVMQQIPAGGPAMSPQQAIASPR